jgi:hypothetical protein
MKAGERFEVIAPSLHWNVHHNMVTGCMRPLVLDSYGIATSLVRDNMVTRGDTTGVKAAIEVYGIFQLTGNQIAGFDEAESTARWLVADPLGRTVRSTYRENVFHRCTAVVPESQKTLWEAVKPEGNVFTE